MKSLKGYVFILAAVTFWGVSAALARFLFTLEIKPLILVQTRMTFSFLVLLAVFLLFRRDVLRVKVKDLYRFALLGIVGAAGSNFLYYVTIKETNVATAILLQYLAPLLVLAYAAISREEELNATKLVAGGVSLVGCFLAVAGKEFSLVHISQLGLLTGLGAACTWAFSNIWLRRLVREYSSWTMLVYAFAFGSAFWLCVNSPSDIIAAGYSGKTWWLFFGFAMISILIPHSFYFMGIRYLTASQAIITATFEPVIAILMAYVFLNEILTPVQILGAVLVISAIIILQRKKDPVQEAYEVTTTSVHVER